MSARRTAIRRACRTSGIATWNQDLATVRGRCQHGRCKSRYAVVRVTLDFRLDPVERYAATECTACGRTWRRVRVPALRSPAGYQSTRLTIILPARVRRWRSRGHWRREGDDAAIVVDADLGDVDEAARAHERRATARAIVRERRKAREAAETAALMARLRAAEEAAAIRRAAREADEAAAAAREMGGLA